MAIVDVYITDELGTLMALQLMLIIKTKGGQKGMAAVSEVLTAYGNEDGCEILSDCILRGFVERVDALSVRLTAAGVTAAGLPG